MPRDVLIIPSGNTITWSDASDVTVELSQNPNGDLVVDGYFRVNGVEIFGYFPIMTVYDGTYSLSTSDSQRYIRFDSSGDVTVTILSQSSISWLNSTEIVMEQTGSGQIIVNKDIGVTLNSTKGAYKSLKQYSVIFLKRVNTDVWTLFGDLQLV